MGLFSRLLRIDDEPTPQRRGLAPVRGHDASSDDQRAIDRYRYMIQTAPPETIEQAHLEAFERLTPEQRRQLLGAIAEATPPGERATLSSISADDPSALARAATRAEIREPGVMERTLSRPGLGFGASLLTSFAGAFAGSLVAQSFLSAFAAGDPAEAAAGDEPAAGDGSDAEPDVVADDGSFDLGDFEI
jgi:hypothetical protein